MKSCLINWEFLPVEGAIRDRKDGAYQGMYPGGYEERTSRKWIDTNIREVYGLLNAQYYPPKY